MRMPNTLSKNFSMSPAAQDLGLGDMVKQQLEDEDVARKKKLIGGAGSGQFGQNFGPATLSLFGGTLA